MAINDKLVLISGASATGKAQPLHCEIQSPIPNTTFASIEVGTPVYGEDGLIYQVTAIHEQGIKPSYNVTFTDGSSTECCDEHLWTYYRSKAHLPNKEGSYTDTLAHLMKGSLTEVYFKTNQAVPMAEQAHLISPYLMGSILAEQEMVNRLCSEELLLGCAYITECKRLGIFGLKSYEKGIPKEYLYDSIPNRMDLLRSLVDCDGSVDKAEGKSGGTTTTFCTTSVKLKTDFMWLARSLGYSVSVHEDFHTWKYMAGVCFTINIRNVVDRPLPFSSTKHISRYVPPVQTTLSHKRIKDIEYVGDTVMRCITVSNPTSLYLTDDFIITHNSAAFMGMENQEGVLYACTEAGKRLPFKSKFNEFVVTDPMQVPTLFQEAENAGDKIHTVIIDSFTFLMDQYESQFVLTLPKSQTMGGWSAYAQYLKSVMQLNVAASTKNVFITAHTAAVSTVADDGSEVITEIKAPIKGAVGKTGYEAYFSMVVSTKKISLKQLEGFSNPMLNITEEDEMMGFKYVFQNRLTKETINEKIRAPMGMWTSQETYIDNNVQHLITRLDDYYN